MENRKNEQEETKQQVPGGSPAGAGQDNQVVQGDTPEKKDTDTEPDEFIGPNADTDQPVEGQIRNDAVLRGEEHADDNILNWPVQEKPNDKEEGTPKKMDAGKL